MMRALFAVCLAILLASCSWQRQTANLLKVSSLDPDRVDIGDRIELLGDGFPEGKAATLTFHGSLFRPGQPAIHDQTIVLRAEGSSMRRLTTTITQEMQADFCGVGDEAANTTFRGYVVAAFAPRSLGAPPITGVLDGVVLEIIGAETSAETTRQRLAKAQQTLAHAGIKLRQDAPGRLIVAETSGLSGQAGLLAGDELLELDGVRLSQREDFIPPGDSSEIHLVVGRPSVELPFELALESDAFRHTAVADLALAALLLALAAGIMLALRGPLPVTAGWLMRSVRLRLLDRSRGSAQAAVWLKEALQALWRPLWEMPLLLRLAPHLSFIAIVAMWTALAFGGEVLAAGLDSVLILACANTSALLAALVLGGKLPERRWSILKGLLTTLQALSFQLPMLLSFVSALLLVGSFRLTDIVRVQGGLPHEWLAFRSPGTWLAFGLFLASLLPQAPTGSQLAPEAAAPYCRATGSKLSAFAATASLADWVHLWLVSGLGSAVFLGGWSLPTFMHVGGLTETILGAAVFQAKIWTVALTLTLARWLLHEIQFGDVVTFAWKLLIPLALVCAFTSLAWARGSHLEVLRLAQPWLSASLVAVSALGLLWVLARLFTIARSPQVHRQVNPWL